MFNEVSPRQFHIFTFSLNWNLINLDDWRKMCAKLQMKIMIITTNAMTALLNYLNVV